MFALLMPRMAQIVIILTLMSVSRYVFVIAAD